MLSLNINELLKNDPCGKDGTAEKQTPHGLDYPQPPAENCGKETPTHANPQKSANFPQHEPHGRSTFPQIRSFRRLPHANDEENTHEHLNIGRTGSSLYRSPPTFEELKYYGCIALADDLKFLAVRLPKTAEQYDNCIATYADKWRQGMKNEPVDFKRQNAGRRHANLWLLDQSENNTRSSAPISGLYRPPPGPS